MPTRYYFPPGIISAVLEYCRFWKTDSIGLLDKNTLYIMEPNRVSMLVVKVNGLKAKNLKVKGWLSASNMREVLNTKTKVNGLHSKSVVKGSEFDMLELRIVRDKVTAYGMFTYSDGKYKLTTIPFIMEKDGLKMPIKLNIKNTCTLGASITKNLLVAFKTLSKLASSTALSPVLTFESEDEAVKVRYECEDYPTKVTYEITVRGEMKGNPGKKVTIDGVFSKCIYEVLSKLYSTAYKMRGEAYVEFTFGNNTPLLMRVGFYTAPLSPYITELAIAPVY